MSSLILPNRFYAQPQYPVILNPDIPGLVPHQTTVWTPSMGLLGVGGASESLAKSAHVSEAIGAGGVGREWKFTGTDYNSGLSTTGASSWFLVLGSTLNTTGNNVELLSASGSGNNGIRVTSTNYPEFRVASTTHITGYQLAAGQSIYARFTTSSYVLSQRNKGTGSITWQTSSANYGTISPNWIMDAKSLSVALAIRFGYSPPRATIEYLHLNPWAIFKAPARRILVGVATTEPGAGEVTGTLTATEAQDSAAIVGNVLITCTLSATEAQDNASFTGSVINTITGTLAATEAQDNASFAGNVYITGTLAATEPQDSAVFSGPVAVSEQTPNRAGGSYASRKRQKIVLLERVEDVEDFVEQVEQVVKEAPKAKPVLRKVKKLRPQTVENTYDNAQAWVDYYQRIAEALRDREQAAQLQADLERGAKMLESVLAMRETQELLRSAKRREDEELILMLMAA